MPVLFRVILSASHGEDDSSTYRASSRLHGKWLVMPIALIAHLTTILRVGETLVIHQVHTRWVTVKVIVITSRTVSKALNATNEVDPPLCLVVLV